MTTSIPLHVIRFASALFGSPKQIHSIKMQRVLSSPFYYIIGDIEIRSRFGADQMKNNCKFLPRAVANRLSVCNDGSPLPFSNSSISDLETPESSASCSCVKPFSRLASVRKRVISSSGLVSVHAALKSGDRASAYKKSFTLDFFIMLYLSLVEKFAYK